MPRFDGYMICTAPRSGSTLLCRMLAATGVAGCPESYFYEPTVQGWADDLGLTLPAATSDAERLDAVLQAVWRKGRGATGVFALRQQAPGLHVLCAALARRHPQEATDADRIRRTCGNLLYVHLSRADKVAQAVSWAKAEQSGLWHVASDGAEVERTAPHRTPVYDAERLTELVAEVQRHDRIWNDWFTEQGISPLRIGYDDLATRPGDVLARVLDALGLDRRLSAAVGPDLRPLADAGSREWAARYRAGQGIT